MTATLQPQDLGVVLAPTTVVEPSPVVRSRVRALGSWLRANRGHGVWIAVWSTLGIMGTLWSPLLFDNPVLLMALAPRTAFVFLAADDASLSTFVVLGTLRLGVTDASWYIVGKRSPGRTLLERAPSRWAPLRLLMRGTNMLCSWLCRHRLLAGLVLFLRPNARYLGVAGAYEVCPRVAGVASVVGTVAYLVAIHQGLGFFFG